jgi:hypothetical protein
VNAKVRASLELKSRLLDRYADQIEGVLGCFDRIILTGTLVDVAHPEAVLSRLYALNIRCFDLKFFAEPLRDQVRDNAILRSREAGLEIEFLERRGLRKEDRIAEILEKRGRHPGLVHVFSAMESCRCFKPWHNKRTGKTGLKLTGGRCLHYYFYFIDEELGLGYVRVPTWLPFRLQVYFNQHQWLANQMRAQGLKHELADNTFVACADWAQAQALVDRFAVKALAARLQSLAEQFCPVIKTFPNGCHWSLMQVEYALDVVFKSAAALRPVYEEISRQAIFTVKAPDVARFLGKRLSPEAEVTSDFHTRVEGTRIKHQLNRQAIKMYDKAGRVLRLECVSNDVSFYRHHRKVEHRDGTSDYRLADLKKSVFSLGDLRALMRAGCARYLNFLGELEDRSPGQVNLDKISRPIQDQKERSWRGFNFFLQADLKPILAMVRGEFQISGLSNRRLRPLLPDKTGTQIGRILKRMRLHGLIKKIGKTYKYYLTELGRRTLLAGLKLKEHLIVPTLNSASCETSDQP